MSERNHGSSSMAVPTTILGILLVIMIVFLISMNVQITKISNSLSGSAVKDSIAVALENKGSQEQNSQNMKINSEEHVKGQKDAPVTIVEYSDFQCPFCQSFFENAYKKIITDYVDTGKAKIIFKQFPLYFHQNAQKAAEASECAGEQGKFWEYHDLLFSTKQLDATTLKKDAVTLGLDADKFNTCLDSGKYAQKIRDDTAEGQSKGVSGTPSFLINGKKVVGAQSYDVFKAEIDAALA